MLLNERTQKLLDSFCDSPTSTVLVVGATGAGAELVVEEIIRRLLPPSERSNIVTLEPHDEKSIGVSSVRELKQSLTTATSREGVSRIAVVRHAEKLTLEAQNALLKLIEEPVRGAMIILQANSTASLLNTVRSRCQAIKVLPLSEDQARAYAESHGHTEAEARKAYLLSGGESVSFQKLLSADGSDIHDTITIAKSFVTYTVFERLARQKEFTDAAALSTLLAGIMQIAEAAMHSARPEAVQRWKTMVETARSCQDLMARGTPAKLVFLQACTSL